MLLAHSATLQYCCFSIDIILQSSELHERGTNSETWNCSVQHWTRYQRHFRCNLRQECVSGEDELHCPYAPCQNGGVSFAGHCYFFLATDDRVTRSSAERECRMAGANVVSLASPREWSDVISWLHMGIPWLDTPAYMILYLGLMQPTSTSPFM